MFHDVAEIVFWAELLSGSNSQTKTEAAKRLEILEDRCACLVRRCRATLESMQK